MSNNEKGIPEKSSDKFQKIKDYGIPLGVMAMSLVVIYILWASFGYIGPSFSNQVLSNQQETLREKYNLPTLEGEDNSITSEVPPSLREVLESNTTTTKQSSTNTTISESSGNVTSGSTQGGQSTVAAAGVTLTILEGSSIQGNPDFDPDELTVKKGDKIVVNNADTMPHTVTNGESGSDPNSGKLFDTSIINGGDSAEIDTSAVDAGAHPFYCMVHPYMTGSLTIE
ncbi:MAG TPA: plastocyanin/azurin family copper-binding protein [Nitrososphaeraceae archaeon]